MGWLVGLFITSLVVALVIGPAISKGAPIADAPHPSFAVRPDLTQLDNYQLRQIALPGFAYLYPYLYNYRLQYPTVGLSGPCAGGVLYITNTSVLDCYTIANATAWAISPTLTLLYQRTVGIQAQIDNEFQLDSPGGVALLYGNRTTASGVLTVEAVNLTTGVLKIADTPVPMGNSVQCDYVGAWLVTCFNGTGAHGAPELTNLSNGTSWRSGLSVGVAPNNVYWVPQLDAFIDVAGTHVAELRFNAARTTLTNVGNAWVNTTGVTSVTAVGGVAYYPSTGQIAAQLATNLGGRVAVVKLTGGVLTPAGAYSYASSQTFFTQRYAYTSGFLWCVSGGATDLFDPISNATIATPNIAGTQNASGANGNFEFSSPTTTAYALSLNVALTGNATRAPNQFVWASYPVALHTRSFVLTNAGARTPAYQQKIVVNSALDAGWSASNLSNVFWTYASNGTSIPAWLESNASSASSTTVWWLSLAAIGHGASVTISEQFAATTALTFGAKGVTGEAPQLTGTYGAFDNGAIVFPLYDGFVGSTLNAGLWVSSMASGTLAVSNGLTTASVQTGAATQAACGLVARYQNVSGSSFAVDTFGTSADTSRFGPMTVTATGSSQCATANTVLQNLDVSNTASTAHYFVFSQASAGTYNTNTVNYASTLRSASTYLWSLNQTNSSNGAYTQENYSQAHGGPFGNLTHAAYVGLYMKANSGTIGPVDWVRERVLPPLMPTIAGVPLAPTSLAVTATAVGTLHATWVNPPGTITNDTLFRWSGPSCVGTPSTNSTGGSATSWTIGGLAVNATYAFEVAASNATGTGPGSACVPASTFAVPLPPTGLAQIGTNLSNVTVLWVNPGGTVTNDTIFLFLSPTCAGAVSATISTHGAATSGVVPNLAPGSTYGVRVSASNASGTGNPSSCLAVTTSPAPPWWAAAPQSFPLWVVILGIVAFASVLIWGLGRRR